MDQRITTRFRFALRAPRNDVGSISARIRPGPMPTARHCPADAVDRSERSARWGRRRHLARCGTEAEKSKRRRARLCKCRRLRLCRAEPLDHRLRRRGRSRSHPAPSRPPAYHPWPVRVRPRGAARRNHRRGRRAARQPPLTSVRAASASTAAGPSRDRRAIDRCRRRRPPAAGSVRPADAAPASRAARWHRVSRVRSVTQSARNAPPSAG